MQLVSNLKQLEATFFPDADTIQIVVGLMDLLYQTRFSYVGQSGWKSDASKDKRLLFDPRRMRRRFELFEKITLASLARQTDPDFKLVLLTALSMPETYAKTLEHMCFDILGADRVTILARPPRVAGKVFKSHTQTSFEPDQKVCQVVLDDDDAVSQDFTEVCKDESRRALLSDYDDDPTRFLSFARGKTLYVEDGKLTNLSDKHSPLVNLGLTLASRADTDKHPFLTSHLAIAHRHPSLVINTVRPFYLRTVHDHNDSRSPHKTEWLTPEEIADVAEYFPFLKEHFKTQIACAA